MTNKLTFNSYLNNSNSHRKEQNSRRRRRTRTNQTPEGEEGDAVVSGFFRHRKKHFWLLQASGESGFFKHGLQPNWTNQTPEGEEGDVGSEPEELVVSEIGRAHV